MKDSVESVAQSLGITTVFRGHGGRVVTLSPPTSAAGV